MKRFILTLLLCCSSALGQETVVTADAVKVGTMLTCPRFSTLYANKLVVPAETTVTLPAAFDYDVIEVSGTLKLSRTYDTSGKVIVIQVLPGGSLDFGTESDPVLRKVDIQIKDSPLLCGTDGNLGPDPEQFGSGILVFGEWKSYGRQLNKTWTTFQPASTGATTLTLTDTVNWQVGDELILPDYRVAYSLANIGLDNRPRRRERPVRIAAISGNTVTLDKPLDFEHQTLGGVLPHVANCTRNIVIRSENPSGVRGHTMFMGTAHVNLYYTSFIDLGRTRPETLDSYNSHTMHVGTNQIARYGGPHHHHVHGHADAQGYTGRVVGCFGRDSLNVTKWFVVQHGTHDELVTDNVADGFRGACFTTEDGFEVRGEYRRNFAYWCLGNGIDAKSNVVPSLNNAPGAEGAGFWFHGSHHTVDGNVAFNCRFGFQDIHMTQVLGRKIPDVPGGDPNTDYDPQTSTFISNQNNLAIACSTGVEEWLSFNAWNGYKAINCYNGVKAGEGEGGGFALNDFTLLIDDPTIEQVAQYLATRGIHSSMAYTSRLTLKRGTIKGFDAGLIDSRFDDYEDVTLANRTWDIKRDENADGYDLWPLKMKNVRLSKMISGQGKSQPPTLDMIWANIGHNPPPWNHQNLHRAENVNGDGKAYWIVEPSVAPANAISLPWLVNAKAVLDGSAPPPAPTISAITASPPDVDPTMPGVQEYPGPVTYSVTANGPVTWFYSTNGGPRTQYGTGDSITFTYSQLVNYVWYAVNGAAESSLAVQVVAKPVTPPASANVRVTLPDGSVYEGAIPKK